MKISAILSADAMIAATKYLAREDHSDNHQIKPATSSVILKILKILIQNHATVSIYE
jgi:hypothetical protein